MNFDYTKLWDFNYLLDSSPDGFNYANESILLALTLIIVGIVTFWLFKKRREFIKLEKEQRMVYRKHTQISLVLSIVLLLFILIRTQGINFLSMRIIPFLLSLSIIINTLVAIIRARLSKPVAESVVEKEFDYMKYIPKKKRK